MRRVQVVGGTEPLQTGFRDLGDGDDVVVVNLESAALLRAFALFLHRGLVAVKIELKSSLTRNIIRQINGKSVRVIKPKHQITWNESAFER